jgi:hypothetical protein
MTEKRCNNCKKLKETKYFNKHSGRKDGYNDICKICKREKDKEYYKKNSKKLKEYQKKYRENNKEKIKQDLKKYYIKNKKKIREYQKKYKPIRRKRDNKRYQEDICFRLRCIVSTSIRSHLKKDSEHKWFYLPYTSRQLKEHLENQFEDWMSWDNYGIINKNKKTWQIDHIIPHSKLSYDSLEHPNFQKCWALENLRPLEAFKNIKKSNKIENP